MNKCKGLIAALSAVAVSAMWSLPVVAQSAPQKITFLTNYVFNGRHAPFFVGLEKGYYREAGFDIEISPATGSGFVITAVDSGQADYGMADFSSVVRGVSRGAKVGMFMVYTDISTNGLAALSPHPTPESVAGKKIAAGQTDSVRVILPIIYSSKNLDASQLNWQAADPGVYISLLLSGQVDLMTATSDGDVPALAKVAASQGKSVHFSSFADWGYDIFGFVLIGSKDRLEENPDATRRFSEATKRAVDYAIENPDETAEIMVKHNSTMKLDTVKAQWRETIKSMRTPYVERNGYGVATDERMQESIDLVRQALDIDSSIHRDAIYKKVD